MSNNYLNYYLHIKFVAISNPTFVTRYIIVHIILNLRLDQLTMNTKIKIVSF